MNPTKPITSDYTWQHDNLRHWLSLGLNLQDEMTRLKIPSLILDVGCGKREHATMLEHYDHLVYTVDGDATNTPDYKIDLIKEGLLKTLEGERNRFDAITCHHTLEHIPFFYFRQTLHDFYFLLKPNGYLFITLPVRCRPLAISLRLARWEKFLVRQQIKSFSPNAFHYWEVSREHPPQDIIEQLKTTGFENVEVLRSAYNPFEIRFIAQKNPYYIKKRKRVGIINEGIKT